MNSRSCRWLIVSALVITASGAWAQQSAPPASDQGSIALFELSEQRAANGNATAQWELGNFYEIGFGVPQDYAQAAFWYRKAAEQGDAVGQGSLGRLYYEGRGVAQDYAQALAWYRKAVEQGEARAQEDLGDLYYKGRGVPQDYAQAASWYRKAAEQGDTLAQDALGNLYLDGQGVSRDYAEAYFWYDLATAGEQDASDSKQVAKYRDKAASHLTPTALARSQERARK